jgi:hypothetical protein
MKNIHILPTEKPSRLYKDDNQVLTLNTHPVLKGIFTNGIGSNQHIYITNSEEIKEEDWVIENHTFKREPYIGKCFYPKNDGTVTDEVLKRDLLSVNYEGHYETLARKHNCKKIILTTDQDLIKDGVQAISDEFLELFVKNLNCEEVEVGYGWIRLTETNNEGYWVSIPDNQFEMQQEKPKQYPIGGYAPGYYSCTCVTCKKEFTGDKRAVQCEPCAIQMTREEPKQKKDLAYWKANAEEDYIKVPISVLRYIIELEKRMYSEEEVLDIINSFEKLCYTYQSNKDWFPAKKSEWFEKFKKK